jgi:hypothetical protein
MSRLQHHKVKLMFSAGTSGVSTTVGPLRPFPKKNMTNNSNKNNAEEEEKEQSVDVESSDVIGEEAVSAVDGESSDSDGFENVEEEAEGPELLHCNESQPLRSGGGEGVVPTLRLVMVREDDLQHRLVIGEAIPSSLQQSLDLFAKQ